MLLVFPVSSGIGIGLASLRASSSTVLLNAYLTVGCLSYAAWVTSVELFFLVLGVFLVVFNCSSFEQVLMHISIMQIFRNPLVKNFTLLKSVSLPMKFLVLAQASFHFLIFPVILNCVCKYTFPFILTFALNVKLCVSILRILCCFVLTTYL